MVRCVAGGGLQLSIVRRILSSPHKNPGHGGWADRQQAGAWPLLLLGQVSRQLLGAAAVWVVHIGPDWGLGPRVTICLMCVRTAAWCGAAAGQTVHSTGPFTESAFVYSSAFACSWGFETSFLTVCNYWLFYVMTQLVGRWYSWYKCRLADNLLVLSSFCNYPSISRRFTLDPIWWGNLQYKFLNILYTAVQALWNSSKFFIVESKTALGKWPGRFWFQSMCCIVLMITLAWLTLLCCIFESQLIKKCHMLDDFYVS